MCVEAFCLKDEDFIKDEVAAFIQYYFDMHVYNHLLDVWQASLAKLKKTTHVAKWLEMHDKKIISRDGGSSLVIVTIASKASRETGVG